MTALATHTDFVSIADGIAGDGKQVSTLELARARLMNPVALVAPLFPPTNPSVSHAALSIETDPLNMFSERSGDEGVRPGLHAAESDGEIVFGIYRRARRSDSKMNEAP